MDRKVPTIKTIASTLKERGHEDLASELLAFKSAKNPFDSAEAEGVTVTDADIDRAAKNVLDYIPRKPRYTKPKKAKKKKAKASAEATAVIRKEGNEWCVRSPDNPTWNGGCYDTKEKAEKRLRQVEFFKHQG